jgi:hypothetical protein
MIIIKSRRCGISRSISKILCSVACRCAWKLFATSGFNNYHLSPVLYCIVPDRDKSSMIERYWHDTHTGAKAHRQATEHKILDIDRDIPPWFSFWLLAIRLMRVHNLPVICENHVVDCRRMLQFCFIIPFLVIYLVMVVNTIADIDGPIYSLLYSCFPNF